MCERLDSQLGCLVKHYLHFPLSTKCYAIRSSQRLPGCEARLVIRQNTTRPEVVLPKVSSLDELLQAISFVNYVNPYQLLRASTKKQPSAFSNRLPVFPYHKGKHLTILEVSSTLRRVEDMICPQASLPNSIEDKFHLQTNLLSIQTRDTVFSMVGCVTSFFNTMTQ